jgi:heptaprenyl diphosphate synthase
MRGSDVIDTHQLFAPVADDLMAVHRCLLAAAEGQHPLLAQALTYVFERKGKRLRPALVLLSGLLGRYDLDRLVLLAASLEVVHTASLVHDDTIDEALTRRGLTTLNTLWDRHTAIITGDYLFAKSAELASRINSVRIMHMLSETVMAMCSGELRQHATAYDWTISIDEYFARIGEKTASLFAMCCAGAGVITGQAETQIAALREYGYNLGLAYQIIDDILDFTGDEDTLGKPAGNDLRHGTITLPALLFWQHLAPDSPLRQRLVQRENAELALELIRESGALDEAHRYVEDVASRARKSLALFPPSEAQRALLEISEYILGRTS